MKKTLILTFVFALITFVKAWSQTEPATTKPAPKDKTEQMKKAEEKSDGAAYSGKGKGGDKDMVEKDKSKKNKKDKKNKKSKKAKKDKKGKADMKDKEAGEAKEEDMPKPSKTKQPGNTPQPEGKQAPQPKKLEPKNKSTETTPKQKTGSSGN